MSAFGVREDPAHRVADLRDAPHDLVARAELLGFEIEIDNPAGIHHEIGGVQDAGLAPGAIRN